MNEVREYYVDSSTSSSKLIMMNDLSFTTLTAGGVYTLNSSNIEQLTTLIISQENPYQKSKFIAHGYSMSIMNLWGYFDRFSNPCDAVVRGFLHLLLYQCITLFICVHPLTKRK